MYKTFFPSCPAPFLFTYYLFTLILFINYFILLKNTVEVYCEDDEEVETYRIVTSVRGSSLNGLVSIESPLGKALLGHKEGDRVFIKVNDDFGYYFIVKKVIKTQSEDEDHIRSF